MLLTKDNILKFVKERKYILPTDISKEFDTSTMIASASLSDLSSNNLINYTHLKKGESSFYYHISNKESLVDLSKYLSENKNKMFLKLKEKQILSKNQLPIQEQLSIEQLKDFAVQVQVTVENKNYTFYVWYLRNIEETKKQILSAFNTKQEKKIEKIEPIKVKKTTNNTLNNYYSQETKIENSKPNVEDRKEDKNLDETTFIENYFKNNNLEMIEKSNQNDEIKYLAKKNLLDFKLYFDCLCIKKKVTLNQIIQFYTSSLKPKIIFVKNPSKAILKQCENFVNLKIINIE